MMELIRLVIKAAWASTRTRAGQWDIKTSAVVIGISIIVATEITARLFSPTPESGFLRKILVGVTGVILGPLVVFLILFLISLYLAASTILENIKQSARDEQKTVDLAEIKDLQDKLAATQQRNQELVRQLPMPSLTEEQKNNLTTALAVLPRQTVSINYLDDYTARNGAVVQALEEAFLKANWHILRYPRKWLGAVFSRITIRVESGSSTASDAAVIDAFNKAHVSLNRGCCPEWPRDKSADVEIIVGEM